METSKNAHDLRAKELFQDNDVFASLFNAYLYHGAKVIDPKCITELDSSVRLDHKTEIRQDVVRKWHKGSEYCIFNLEHQSTKDRTMVFRMMRYETAQYLKEYNSSDDHLKPLHPVISIVLYTGKGDWEIPQELYDIVDVPNDLKEYINNYKIHVISLENYDKYIRLEDISNTILKETIDICSHIYKKDMKGLTSKYNRKVDPRVCRYVGTFTKTEIFENIDEKKGAINMCEMIDELVQEGVKEGSLKERLKAILKLFSKGMSKEFILDLGYTEQEINEALKV